MKKNFFTLFGALILSCYAMAQAPKYALFEHFTNASCGPCAAQNPGFKSTILTPNPGTVRHIAYHTVWPGVDPMNALNPVPVADRVLYYGVQGVPDVVRMGTDARSPSGFSQMDVDDVISTTSPIEIKVNRADSGTFSVAQIEVKTVGQVAASNLKLRVAVIERTINYATAPGNNGEKDFENVMRAMLPDAGGTTINLAPVGQSVTFDFNFNHNAAWNMNEIAIIAFIQSETDKAVLNVGSTFDPVAVITNNGPVVLAASQGNPSVFQLTATNNSNQMDTFNVVFNKTQPNGWLANYTVNGMTFPGNAQIIANPFQTVTASINVTPSAVKGLGEYELEVTSRLQPTKPAWKIKVYALNPYNNLLIHSAAVASMGNATTWASAFTNGLNAIGANYTEIKSDVATRAYLDNAVNGVNTIWYNAGWTFPFTTDSLAAEMSNLMKDGGNVFISGQDIAWETFDPQSTSTSPAKVNLLNNGFKVGYVNDGSSANSRLTPFTTDPIFAAVGQATISPFYGPTNFFPDELSVQTGGVPIFYYNTNQNKIGGVRTNLSGYKSIYIAPGMEMLSNAASSVIRDSIISKSYQWFNGIISGTKFDAAMAQLNQNYPNPATDFTRITLPVNNEKGTLTITDVTGRTVKSVITTAGSTFIELSVSDLAPGTYQYSWSSTSTNTATQKMVVVR